MWFGLLFFRGKKMLDRKQFLVIQKLVENQIVNKEDLQKSLNLTSRQVDYNLEKINDLLKVNKKQLINYDGAFISVPDDAHEYLIKITSNSLTPDEYVFNRSERLDLIFLFLCNGGYVSINDIVDILDVSFSTVHKDLNILKTKLKTLSLNLEYKTNRGYLILGKEKNIRSGIANIVVTRISNEDYRILNWFYDVVQGQDINEYIKNISEKAKQLNISFVEDHKLQFIYTYVAELVRIREFPDFVPLQKINFDGLEQTEEWKLAADILRREGIDNKNSVIYVTILLLCTTIGGENKFDFDTNVFKYDQKFVKEFASLSGIDFLDISEIEKQVFTHFRSMYFRKIFGFPVNNPLTEQIKKVYSNVFALVKQALLVIKNEIGLLPDSEVAFLTLHLMNFIYAKRKNNINKPVAAIICQNGIATSTLLYLQLTNIFPELDFLPPFEYRELDEKIKSIDIIFSTFYRPDLFTKNKPCFIVNPVMTANERSILIQKVHLALSRNSSLSVSSVLNIVDKYISDKSLLTKIQNDLNKSLTYDINRKKNKKDIVNSNLRLLDVINIGMLQLNIEADNAKEAIRKSARPLINEKIVLPMYVDEIIRKHLDKNYNDFIIAPDVALPHTKPSDGARKIGMSITTLKKPCNFGTKFGGDVKYIFTLSALDKSSHLGILKDLTYLLSDSNFFELLDEGSKKDIINYLEYKLSK